MEKKKFRCSSEIAYLFASVLIALSVATITATDFGVSMVVAPAYILSLRFPVLTFGMAEYVVQGLLLIALFVLVGKIKPLYFFAFGTGFIYGLALDFWRWLIPILNPEITAPGDFPMAERVVLFIIGTLLTGFAVAIYFRVYLYPQVYEFFVKVLAERFSQKTDRLKTIYDVTSFSLSVALSLLFFKKLVGIGVGTLISTMVTGPLILFFGKILDRFVEFRPSFPKLEEKMKI